jgi:hypothetical protein
VTFPVEFSAEAEEELDVAAVWFDEQRSGLGSEFVEAIEEVLSVLAEWPRTGSIVEDASADRDPASARFALPLPRRIPGAR